jgi:hypothetical protein
LAAFDMDAHAGERTSHATPVAPLPEQARHAIADIVARPQFGLDAYGVEA